MAEIVNLTRARKAKTRHEKTATAVANRALHGRTRTERAAEDRENARREATLDGAKREDRRDLE